MQKEKLIRVLCPEVSKNVEKVCLENYQIKKSGTSRFFGACSAVKLA